MNRLIMVCVALLTSGCQNAQKPHEPATNEQGKPANLGTATGRNQTQKVDVQPASIKSPTSGEVAAYDEAISCYTLADIMNTVGKEMPHRAEEFEGSGASFERLKAEAIVAGLSVGRGPAEVNANYEAKYMELVGPLRTASAEGGATAIEGFARRLALCL